MCTRTRACGVEIRLGAYLGIRTNYKQASRRVSTRHARVRALRYKFLRKLRTLCDEQTIFLLLMHRPLSCPAARGPATADLLSGRFCRAPPSRVAPYSASLERTLDQRTALSWHFRSRQRSAAFLSESPAHPGLTPSRSRSGRPKSISRSWKQEKGAEFFLWSTNSVIHIDPVSLK